MADDKSKSEEFVRPNYHWEKDITDIVPHSEPAHDDEISPILLVRDGDEVKSHNFTLPFLIERLGIDERYFVPHPTSGGIVSDGMVGVYINKRIFTAQFLLQQLASKDFILSDRVFRRRHGGIYPMTYGFQDVCATTTIGSRGHFLSFYWSNEMAVPRHASGKIEERFSSSFHNLEYDIVHERNHESPNSDSDGQRYLECLESAVKICVNNKKVPALALLVLYRGITDAIKGKGWTLEIFDKVSIEGRQRLVHLVDLSLSADKYQTVQEAYARFRTAGENIVEILEKRIG